MYWRFLLGLFLVSLVFPFIYSFLVLPVLALAIGSAAAKERSATRHTLASPLLVAAFIGQLYILCGWAAYVAARTLVTTSREAVTQDWIYYVTAFFLLLGPLSYMASKEPEGGSTGTVIHTLAAGLAFLLFCIWPSLMAIPYGWFLRWIFR